MKNNVGIRKMKVALYARVSTRDKNQEPETQLIPLREATRSMGAECYREYIDTAAAQDMRGRIAWRQLLDEAAKRRFGVVIVFKLDRAFRSVWHMHNTLAVWESLGIMFVSVREQFDTTTAAGRLMLNLLGAMAEFESELIRERVQAGMNRAANHGTRSGKPIGRPAVKIDVEKLFNGYRRTRSIRGAARIAGCNPGTAYCRLRDVGLLEELPPVVV